MYITQTKYPKLWKSHDDLSITERTLGFEVSDELYAKFRKEADETMPHLSDEDKDVCAIYNAHMHPGMAKDVEFPEISEKNSAPHSTAGLPKVLDAAMHLISAVEGASGKIADAVSGDKSHEIDLKLPETISHAHKVDLSHKLVVGTLNMTVEHKVPALDALVAALTPKVSNYKKALLVALWAIVFLLLLLLSGVKLHAQSTTIRGVALGTTPAANVTVTAACVANHNCFDVDLLNIPHVICDSGCGGASSFSDNSAFTVGSTAINVIGGYYTSGAAPTLGSGNAGRLRIDSNSYLLVNCITGCSGGASTPTDAFANPTTAALQMTFNVGYNGSTWDLLRSGDKNNVAGVVGVLNTGPLGRYNATQPTLTDTRYNMFQLSSRGELLVSPGASGFSIANTTFSATGASTPADGFSNPTAAILSQNFLMGWNGSTWDRIQSSGMGDADAKPSLGLLGVETYQNVYNGTSFDMLRSAGVGNNVPSTGLAASVHYCQSNFPLPTILATNYSAVQCDQYGRQIIVDPKDDLIITAINSILSFNKQQRLLGTFGTPIGSIGDALKVTPVQTDPCTGLKQSIAISQTGNTRYVIGSGHRVLICSIFVTGADAENVSLVEGTGSSCGTGTLAVIGGASAANGPNMVAGGGFTHGTGQGTVAGTNISGNDVCLFESGSGRVAGVMTVAFGQ